MEAQLQQGRVYHKVAKWVPFRPHVHRMSKACVPPNDFQGLKKIGRLKKSADFFTDFICYFLVSFLVRIGENPPIWVSHSPTIKENKKMFFIFLNA